MSVFSGTVKRKQTFMKTIAKKKQHTEFNTKEIDTSIHPVDDFFQYVNGTWRKKTKIPEDKSRWGSFDELRERSSVALKKILEELESKKKNSLSIEEQKILNLYISGMDQKKRNADGYKDLLPYITKIENLTKKNIPACLAELNKIGVSPFFALHIDYDDKDSTKQAIRIHQGGLSMPDRDYYLQKDKRSKNIQEKYLLYIKNIFLLMGNSSGDATRKAQVILGMETKIARNMLPRVKTRDPQKNYHKMTVQTLAQDYRPFPWESLITHLRKEQIREVIIDQIGFTKFVSKEIARLPLQDVQTYLMWHLMDAYAGVLGVAFRKLSFEFHGKTIMGTKKPKPVWKQVVEKIDSSMGEAIGKLYVQKHFPPEARKQMEIMVHHVKEVFKERITALDWMDHATKTNALKKLSTLVTKIGYPKKWTNYAKLSIQKDSYVKNVIHLNIFHFEHEVRKVGKKPDREQWHMSPATVNAYYSFNLNEIVFPAAILQYPFFDPARDSAFNYGGIGSVIGHEISHAFDDSGSQFDHQGNMKNWWTKNSKRKFEARAKILVDQYNQYEPLPGQKLNGKLTLGENIADLCGVLVGYYAYQKYLRGNKIKQKDTFTAQQKFFLGYALTEREKARAELRAMYIKTDPHSPSEFRVNGVVKNMQEFFDAFSGTTKHKLYLPKNLQAKIW